MVIPMPHFETSALIAARPDDIWQMLLQIERWPDWDGKLERVDGRLVDGGGIAIRVVDQKRPFKIAVTEWSPPHRLVLAGGMPFGLFTGTRTYTLEPDGDGTRFAMVETYSGPLQRLIGRSIPDMQPSFDAFAAGLRAAVEVGPGAEEVQ